MSGKPPLKSGEIRIMNRLKHTLRWFLIRQERIPSDTWMKNPEEIKNNIDWDPSHSQYQNYLCQLMSDITNQILDENNDKIDDENQSENQNSSDNNGKQKQSSKKALLVGINKYKTSPDSNLRGCVNDVKNMKEILVELYGFEPDNIRVLTDYRATKNNILKRLKSLVRNAKAGDELYFHFSGHGSQVRDRNGDELKDNKDECLITTDHDWDAPLIDDDLGRIFNQLSEEVYLTMTCDSCHSGTMTRGLSPKYKVSKEINPPFDIQARSDNRQLENHKIGDSIKGGQNHVFMSGCADFQTSADAYINHTYQGAFTWALIKAIKANPHKNWLEIHQKVLDNLENKFSQTPQLSGDDDLLQRNVLGGVKEN